MDIWFGVGSVISISFRVFFRHLGTFIALLAVGYVPAFAVIAALVVMIVAGDESLAFAAIGLATIILAFVTMLLTGGVMHAVYHILRGNPVRIGDCVGAALSRIFPLLGVSIVVGILYMVGLILCLVPGFIVLCMFFVAIPVVVVERLGVFDAMSRSRVLTKGHRLEIFGIMAVLYVLSFVGVSVVELVMPTAAEIDATFWLAQGAQWVLQSVLSGVGAVAVAVSYYALRIEIDGLGVEEFAQVFE